MDERGCNDAGSKRNESNRGPRSMSVECGELRWRCEDENSDGGEWSEL